jgi:signal transduction histidine kinase
MTILCGRLDDAASSSGMTSGSSAGTTKDPRTRVKVGDVQTFRSLLDRLRALPAARADALVAAVLLAEGLFEVVALAPLEGAQLALVVGVLTAQAAALAVRRRWPIVPLLAVYGLGLILDAVGSDVSDHLAGPFFWVLLAGYTWGRHTEGARLWAGAVFAAAVNVLGSWIDAYSDGFTSYLSAVCLIVIAPILFGQVLRTRARLNRALRQRNERAEREREAAADAAALEERTRIAGDLHDVVAHALSAMTVQAGAARRMAERDPERAEASFAVVEHTGRDALTELRRLLGVLRREDEELGLAPQPSLAHLRSLIQRAGAAGLYVELRIDGEPVTLPAGVDLTAYRLVQEALRRAREGGRAVRASVRVTYMPGEVRIEVVDDGLPEDRRLLGLRERVAVYGGELKAAAADGGGWRVAARLPVGASA